MPRMKKLTDAKYRRGSAPLMDSSHEVTSTKAGHQKGSANRHRPYLGETHPGLLDGQMPSHRSEKLETSPPDLMSLRTPSRTSGTAFLTEFLPLDGDLVIDLCPQFPGVTQKTLPIGAQLVQQVLLLVPRGRSKFFR